MLKVQEIPITKLKPWEKNPRVNDEAVKAVAESIQEFGFNVPILCDKKYTIIAGHTRWKAAKKLKLSKVPVIVLNIKGERLYAFSIADNKTAELAEWDNALLKKVLADVKKEGIDIHQLGFSDQEIRKLFSDSREDKVSPIKKSKAKVRYGEFWALGRHRLLCGDSRNKDSIFALVKSERVDHIFGGPPFYNLRDYIKWENYTNYENDMLTIAQNSYEVMKEGSLLVWNVAPIPSLDVDLAAHLSLILEKAGLKHAESIAWVKPGPLYSCLRHCNIRRKRHYYPAFQWESLLVYQKPGKMPQMTPEGAKYMSKYDSNVWEVNPLLNKLGTIGHPDSCPVELPYRFMQAYTGNDAVVFDPFGGSGTTLIAAEKANRKAFLVERLPKYCDIIIRRWEELTGERAEKLH